MRSICPAGASARGAGTRQPTQPVATRPLGIRKDGTWYTYGWDLTKNICESPRRLVGGLAKCAAFAPQGRGRNGVRPRQVFSSGGTILTAYTYTPYGSVTANGNVTQPIQWSSEYNDAELGLVYYNYRHYNPTDGRWTGRDLLTALSPIRYCGNAPYAFIDVLGAWQDGTRAGENSTEWKGHSDLGKLPGFDYAKEDHEFLTNPWLAPWLHFRDLSMVEPDLLNAVKACDKESFESNMHRMQDFFAHAKQGYDFPWTLGHLFAEHSPDNPSLHAEDFEEARQRTELWEGMWQTCCCMEDGKWTRRKGESQQCEKLTLPPNPYKRRYPLSEQYWRAQKSEQEAMQELYRTIGQRVRNEVQDIKEKLKDDAQRVNDSIRNIPTNGKYTHPMFLR